MATILDTLVTRLGFQTDKTGLDKAEKGLNTFKSGAVKIAATVGSILAGGFFLKRIAETADETLKWADANGLVIETLGELEFVTQRQGGSIDGLRASLSNMNRAIGEVERGTGRAKLAFEDYGLSVKKANGQTKTADELLIDLNRKFETLTRAQQFDLAMKLGIDKGTIRLLQTAPEEIENLRKEAAKLGVLSRRDAEKAALFVDGLTNIGQAIQAIKFEIGGLLFAPLAKMFNKIADGISFFRRHEKIFKTLIKILGLVGAAYLAMGIKAGVAWLLALGPIFIIPLALAAAGAAYAILWDDLKAFFDGQSSAIGDLVDKWPELGWAIYAVRDAVVIMWDTSVDFFNSFLSWLEQTYNALLKFLLNPIQTAINFVLFLGNVSNQTFGAMFDWLKKIGKAYTEFLINPGKAITDQFKKFPGIKDIGGLFDFSGPQLAPIGSLSPVSAIGASIAGGKISQSVNVGTVNVDARGGNSDEIARNVGAALSDQLKNTVEDFDSSVKE